MVQRRSHRLEWGGCKHFAPINDLNLTPEVQQRVPTAGRIPAELTAARS
jgi:hypothetical protein